MDKGSLRTNVLLVWFAVVVAAFLVFGLQPVARLMIQNGGDGAASPPVSTLTPTPPAGVDVQIAAVPMIKFDVKALSIPANKQTVVRFVNNDKTIVHNFAVYKDRSAKEKIVQGKVCVAPCENTVTVPPLPSGNYFFRCDVHPQQMTGTLEVK